MLKCLQFTIMIIFFAGIDRPPYFFFASWYLAPSESFLTVPPSAPARDETVEEAMDGERDLSNATLLSRVAPPPPPFCCCPAPPPLIPPSRRLSLSSRESLSPEYTSQPFRRRCCRT